MVGRRAATHRTRPPGRTGRHRRGHRRAPRDEVGDGPGARGRRRTGSLQPHRLVRGASPVSPALPRLPKRPDRWKPSVAILGAGAGGIAMGVALTRAGHDYTIYERSDGVGGVWRDNTYPGAQCDVPSHLYSFSFAPNPYWSRTYATQPEILAYLEQVTDRFGVRSHLRTNCGIASARWVEDERQWELTTEAGEQVRADILVSGLGML